jgi:aspartate/methionine/tyrosine aminotransferase
MRFRKMQYLAWARKNIKGARINLANSGLVALTYDELGLDFAGVNFAEENFAGIPAAEAMIAARFGVPNECVLLTAGASQANFLVLGALLDDASEAIVETPVYEPLLAAAESLAGSVKPLPRPFDERYDPRLGDLAALVTERTRVLFLSSPGNPSGTIIARDFLKAAAEKLRAVGGHVVVDEVYGEFFDPVPPPAATIAENIITTSSLTKAYGLGAVRFGWAIGSPDVIADARSIIDHVVGNNSFPSLAVGTRALGVLAELRALLHPRLAANRAYFDDWMRDNPAMKWVAPDTGIIGFPRLPDGLTGMSLFQALKSGWDTTVVPGEFFGDERHIRLSFGCDRPTLEVGLANLSACVKKLGYA